jgi:hypothetical protein
MRGAIPSLPQLAFVAWCLVKQRDTFTFATHFIMYVVICHTTVSTISASEYGTILRVWAKETKVKNMTGVNFHRPSGRFL